MDYIKLEAVTKLNKNRTLLDNIDATIAEGEITTLEGANGSGKTMVLRAILGLIKVTGTVQIKGTTLNINDKYPVKAGILIETPSLIENFTAFQNMKLLAQLQENVIDDDIFDLLQIFDLQKNAHQKVKKFSLGMKQKIGILQAFMGDHPLIVLDEPTNALDEDSIEKLIEIIQSKKKLGTTFIIASHDKYFVDRISDNRLIVSGGKISEK